MRQFAAVEWERANRALQSARLLAEEDPESAASRAYYAAFHAVTALFALRGQTFSRHSAIRAALHRDLIQGGEADVTLGKDFDFLMDLRETGDYGGMTRVSAEGASLAIEKAEALIGAVQGMCPELAR